MPNRLILSFDLEHFPAFEFQGKRFEKQSIELALQGLDSLTKMLAGHFVKATFFVTYDFSLHCRKQLRELLDAGHEIACHGYNHADNYLAMENEEAIRQLRNARTSLGNDLGCRIIGFRAPRMQLLPKNIVAKAGFSYDSSLNPIFLPGHYNNFFRPRKPFRKRGVATMPASATPLFRMPFSFVFFKNFGLGYAKLCSRLCLSDSDFLHVYFHPWDFAEIQRNEFKKVPWYMLRNNGAKTLNALEKYLKWCAGKGIEARTISQYLKEKELL